MVPARGSASTVAASANDTPCFRRFYAGGMKTRSDTSAAGCCSADERAAERITRHFESNLGSLMAKGEAATRTSTASSITRSRRRGRSTPSPFPSHAGCAAARRRSAGGWKTRWTVSGARRARAMFTTLIGSSTGWRRPASARPSTAISASGTSGSSLPAPLRLSRAGVRRSTDSNYGNGRWAVR